MWHANTVSDFCIYASCGNNKILAKQQNSQQRFL